MENKKILITGAAGSIGQELVRQLILNNSVYILDNNETGFFDLYEELKEKGYQIQGKVGDIRDDRVFSDVIRDFGFPQAIFHVAALKHVTPMEWSPLEAIKTNILGTYNVLEFARISKVEAFINISTDKVVNASSVMGATKKVAEILTKNFGYNSVRFGNVMGSRGSVLPIWQRQMDQGQSLTITDPKMIRYMMTIPEAVSLVIEASKMPQDGRVVILDMGEPIKILDLAKEIIKRSGKDLKIKEIGIRPGEALSEELMTEAENKIAKKEGNFWII